jgi:hypothetical protein
MTKKEKIFITVGCAALAGFLLFFWPGFLKGPGGPSRAELQASLNKAEQAKKACESQLKETDSEAQVCEKNLAACEKEKEELLAAAEKAKKPRPKKTVKVEKKASVAQKMPVRESEVDTTSKLATPAEVEVKEGKVVVRTSGFSKVAFFGSHGVCQVPVNYVDLKNGEATVPDLPPECKQFNMLTPEEKWAVVTAGTKVSGACVVQETNGPFTGAYTYSLACK